MMEIPATSQSRIEFWKEPQYTQAGMWWFTLFFGVFGFHHLLLRSPQTWALFLIVNTVTLGYWWFYDLIQLSKAGGVDLNKHGMGTPWAAAGIAQGMWLDGSVVQKGGAGQDPIATAKAAIGTAAAVINPTANAAKAVTETVAASIPNSASEVGTVVANLLPTSTLPDPSKKGPQPAPSPWFFFFYALLLPIGPLSQALAGDNMGAMGRFLDLTVIPFGFLFHALAVLYDYFILLVKPGELFVDGVKRFAPFTWAGWDSAGHSPNLTTWADIPGCPPETTLQTIVGAAGDAIRAPLVLGLPALEFASIASPVASSLVSAIHTLIDPALTAAKASMGGVAEGVNMAATGAKAALAKADEGVGLAQEVGKLATNTAASVEAAKTKLTSFNPAEAAAQAAAQAQAQAKAQAKALLPGEQIGKNLATGKEFVYGSAVGGGKSKPESNSFTLLDKAALTSVGALILGGLFLSLGRVSGNVIRQSDTPPSPW